MSVIQKIELKSVKKSDLNFLFELLHERKWIENISHKKIPTYKKHVEFVMSKPYIKWYIIYKENQRIGSIYLSKQNEIGIHLIKKNKTIPILSDSIKILMVKNPKSRYLVNVSPKNLLLLKLLKKQRFKLLQQTYELRVKHIT